MVNVCLHAVSFLPPSYCPHAAFVVPSSLSMLLCDDGGGDDGGGDAGGGDAGSDDGC